MRRIRLRIVAMPWLLLAALAPPAAADPFAEFRIPEHRLFNWSGSFASQAALDRWTAGEARSDAGSWRGDLSTDVFRLSSRDAAMTTFTGRVFASGARTSSEWRDRSWIDRDVEREALNSSTYQEARVAIATARYPVRVPLFVAIDGSLAGQNSQSWIRSREVQTALDTTSARAIHERDARTHEYRGQLQIGVAGGAGRVRNATGVYEAMVLEQRLREAGAIARALSPVARQQMVDLMYVRDAFGTARDRPAREIWAEIERIVAADGAAGAVSAEAVLRAMEPHLGRGFVPDPTGLPRSPVPRFRGTLFSLGFAGAFVRALRRTDDGQYLRSESGGGVVDSRLRVQSVATASPAQSSVRIAAEVHRPLGPRWQFTATGSAQAPARGAELWARYDGALSAAYLAADRWLARASVLHTWTDEKRTRGPSPRDQADTYATLSADYYLENRTTLTLGAQHVDRWQRGGPPYSPGSAYARNTQLFLRVTHRLVGRFAAPDLALAQSPPAPVPPGP